MGNILPHFFRPRQHQDASFPCDPFRYTHRWQVPLLEPCKLVCKDGPMQPEFLAPRLVQSNIDEWNNTDQQWLGKVAEAFKSWGCRGFWQCHALDASWSFLVPKGLNTKLQSKGLAVSRSFKSFSSTPCAIQPSCDVCPEQIQMEFYCNSHSCA